MNDKTIKFQITSELGNTYVLREHGTHCHSVDEETKSKIIKPITYCQIFLVVYRIHVQCMAA